MMTQLTAKDLMNADVLTVCADLSVRELASFLLDNQISGAPVANDDGNLVGVVSMTDIAAVASKEAGLITEGRNPDFYLRDLAETYSEEDIRTFRIEEPDRRVAEIMTPTVFSIAPHAGVSEVAKLMLEGHLHRVLVVENNRTVGIISTSDMLELLTDQN